MTFGQAIEMALLLHQFVMWMEYVARFILQTLWNYLNRKCIWRSMWIYLLYLRNSTVRCLARKRRCNQLYYGNLLFLWTENKRRVISTHLIFSVFFFLFSKPVCGRVFTCYRIQSTKPHIQSNISYVGMSTHHHKSKSRSLISKENRRFYSTRITVSPETVITIVIVGVIFIVRHHRLRYHGSFSSIHKHLVYFQNCRFTVAQDKVKEFECALRAQPFKEHCG